MSQAAETYQQVIRLQPEHADALHLLGVALFQLGNTGLAAPLIRQALAAAPGHVEAAANLGVVLKAQGELAAARISLARALALKPDHVEAHVNLAAALNASGLTEHGMAAAGRALVFQPDHAEALINRGNAALMLGQLDQALRDSRRVAQLRPASADAQFNLGNACQSAGHLDEAIACYRRALEMRPDFTSALNNLGTALQAADRSEAALACFEQLSRALPADAEAASNHGIALKDQGRLGEARRRFDRALSLRPDYAEAHNNLGLALMAQGDLDGAVTSYRRALALKPNHAAAHSNLLLSLQYDAAASGADIHAESRRWAERHGKWPMHAAFANTREPGRRLKVGYVSADFRTHSVSYFFEALLAAHDRDAVETVCYSDSAITDATTGRLRAAAGQWRSIVGRPDSEVVGMVRADGVDILVDLAGHLGNRRLGVFARRAAPVQATWLGYPGTTGLDTMDWRITDGLADPPGAADREHGELLWRLPGPFLCYRPPDDAPAIGPLPSRVKGQVCFGSFNNLPKLTLPTIALWSRILGALPQSRVLLKSASLADADTCARVRRLFADHGIAAARIETVPWVPASIGHLGLYGQVDIALDTFPYHGTTTTCEAIWMGVPVVSLAGERHAARVGASLLDAVGLQDLVAHSADEYVRIATELATDLPRLHDLRSQLRARLASSRLCDAGRFARDMETAYRGMWQAWCVGA